MFEIGRNAVRGGKTVYGAASTSLMQLYRAGAFLLLVLFPGVGHAEEHFPGVRWEHLPADKAGWSSGKLAEAETWSRQIGLTAVMIVQHGLVVAEWGDTAAKAALASVRKSLLSALIGIAVARDQINIDAMLGSLGIDDNAPSLSDEEKTATVRDLLEARSGVYHPACMRRHEWPSYDQRGSAISREASGITIIGISMPSGRSTKMRRDPLSTTPSCTRLQNRLGCKTTAHQMASTRLAASRCIQPTHST